MKTEVAKIPAAAYTRDAKIYISEATQALRPYVGDGLGESRIDIVLADVQSRYFDGARVDGAANGEIAYDNLAHLESFLKRRLSGASPPNGEAEQAHVRRWSRPPPGSGCWPTRRSRMPRRPSDRSEPTHRLPHRRPGITEVFADLELARVRCLIHCTGQPTRPCRHSSGRLPVSATYRTTS